MFIDIRARWFLVIVYYVIESVWIEFVEKDESMMEDEFKEDC
jgi:hypothetical protein